MRIQGIKCLDVLDAADKGPETPIESTMSFPQPLAEARLAH